MRLLLDTAPIRTLQRLVNTTPLMAAAGVRVVAQTYTERRRRAWMRSSLFGARRRRERHQLDGRRRCRPRQA
jgi:hypothetical protein